MKAEIITIGDELLRGEIIDSNKARIAERLRGLDVETRFQTSVLDVPEDMADAFRRAVGRSQVVLVSGGLGPTRDDLTAEIIAETFGRVLDLHPPSLDLIRSFFARLGREMTENNTKQALFPRGSEVLENPIGTAPGFVLETDGIPIFCMPGVPRELDLMMDEQVLPRIAARRGDAPVQRAMLLRTFGIGESSLDATLRDVVKQGGVVELGFRTSFPDNFLRPVARAASVEDAERHVAEAVRAIREHLGDVVYAEGDASMEEVVGELLREQGKTLAVAESCTGGLIAEKLTRVPGSSDYFLGGIVAYANEAKQALLGVDGAVLDAHGAVSEPVAKAMAEGVRARLGADIGVATTGISGPGGGSEEKPVGTVWVAIARAGAETHAERFLFPLDRERHRVLTAQLALDWVRRALRGLPFDGPSLMRRGGGPPPGAKP